MSEERIVLTAEELWDYALEGINKRTGKPEIELQTLSRLSQKLWGIHRREFIVLGGRPSNGKSALALQMAYDVARQGFQVYFFSLEMSEEALIERLFCNLARVDNQLLRSDSKRFEKELIDFKQVVKDLKLIITYNIGINIEDLYQAIEDLPQADMIVLDYIQAVRGIGDKLSVVNDYILKFRQLCKEKNMAGVMVSQINRGSEQTEGKTPQIYQLKGSGVLEEHSDTVLLCFWEYYYNPQKPIYDYDIIVAKQRNGVTGRQKIHFFPEHYRFEEIEPIYDISLDKTKELFDATPV